MQKTSFCHSSSAESSWQKPGLLQKPPFPLQFASRKSLRRAIKAAALEVCIDQLESIMGLDLYPNLVRLIESGPAEAVEARR